MPVMDLEIEGFSATQRTIIGPAMRTVEISASNRWGNEWDKPRGMPNRSGWTPMYYAPMVANDIDSAVEYRVLLPCMLLKNARILRRS